MENLDQTYKRLIQENSKVDEALKGKQHKIDKNKNGKVDAHDFELLRKEDSKPPFDGPYTKGSTTADSGMNRARNLARSALNKHLNKTYDAYNPDKDKLKKQHFGMAEGSEPDAYGNTGEKHECGSCDGTGIDTHDDECPECGGKGWIRDKESLKKKGVAEEVESIDELSKGTLGNYVKKASRDATITRKIGADFENRADRARSPGMKDSNTELSSKYKQKSWKRRDGLEKAVDRLTKESVDEAFINGREYASHGLMHPDHANTPLHKVTGKTIDFYAHGTGDKVQGTVVYHDQDRVHIRDTKGKKHEFKISKDLPKQTNEEVEQLDEKIYADDYHSTSETSQFGGHRPHVVSKDTGKTMFLGQHSYKTPKHAIEHAQAYLSGYAKTGMHGADRASQAYSTANKHHLHMNEGVYSSDVERAFPNGKASGVKSHAPLAPVPPKKKEPMKPRVGHPTNMKGVKEETEQIEEAKPGLYANINAKRKRIEAGSGERMRKPGSDGAPSSKDFKDAAKTVKEEKDEKEYGYEGDMAMNQLATLTRCADMIKDCLKPDTDLPEWVQSKITLATDYIQTAADYLYSEMKESTTEADKYTIAEDNVDEAWVLRQKKKDKKTVKEESVKTFKDFLAGINEVKLADLPVRRIKGHSYGNQPEDRDDEDDEEDHKPAMKKPEPTEKRGRGRPAGAKSGAKQIGSAPKQKSGVDYSGYKLHLPNSNR